MQISGSFGKAVLLSLVGRVGLMQLTSNRVFEKNQVVLTNTIDAQ